MIVKCETCRFYVEDTTVDGYCHRRAPIVYADSRGRDSTTWPLVAIYSFCGEYEEPIAVGEPVEIGAFAPRTYNCLKNAEINTFGQLSKMRARDLMRLENFGKKSLEEVRRELALRGLALHGEDNAKAKV